MRSMKELGLGLSLALLGSMLWLTGAGAQSLTSVRGLGYPVAPVDARTEIMGGLGIGLGGFAVPLTNPASAAGIQRRGFVLAVENTDREISLGDETGEAGTTRFPLLRGLLPVRGVVLSLGYGGVLDQSWGIATAGETPLGSGDALPFQEVISSTGGLGQVQVGAAMPLGENFALGAAIGALTGNQRIRLTRRFDTTAISDYRPFDETFGWRYSGLTGSAGAAWQLEGVAQAGASVTWSGTVSADSTDGRAVDREFDLPLQVAGGASAYLGPSLLAAVSGRWSGWSASEPAGAAGSGGVGEVLGARDTWEFGVGLELDDPNSRQNRNFPIRVGYQYRQLPFTFVSDAPSEWLVGAGVGMRLGTDADNPLAVVDLGVQRGQRTAAGDGTVGDFEESLWRVSLSVSLFGN